MNFKKNYKITINLKICKKCHINTCTMYVYTVNTSKNKNES